MNTNKTEKELQNKLGSFLSKYFNVFYEVWSVDKMKRIDIVIVHKSDTQRKYPFGIEVKLNELKRGKDLASWLKQCNEYSKKEFIDFGKLIIIAYPPIQINYLREGFDVNNHEGGSLDEEIGLRIPVENKHDAKYHESNNVSTFLGQFGVGELIKKENKTEYICFVHIGKILYDTYSDKIKIENYTKLAEKWDK